MGMGASPSAATCCELSASPCSSATYRKAHGRLMEGSCELSASPCSSATLLSAAARNSSMSCAMSGRSY